MPMMKWLGVRPDTSKPPTRRIAGDRNALSLGSFPKPPAADNTGTPTERTSIPSKPPAAGPAHHLIATTTVSSDQ